jgi:hypothetical protein
MFARSLALFVFVCFQFVFCFVFTCFVSVVDCLTFFFCEDRIWISED